MTNIDDHLNQLIYKFSCDYTTNRDQGLLSTGFEEIDNIIGGYPKGCIIEIVGKEASAKTYMSLKAIEKIHEKGGYAIYYDTDRTFVNSYIDNFDIDPDMMNVIRPDDGHDILDSMDRIIRTGAVSMFIIDSITAIMPKCGEGDAISHLKYISRLTKVISQTIGQSGCYCIFTNQVRENSLGTTSTGGKILRHYANIRINTSRTNKFIRHNDEIIGETISVKILDKKTSKEDRRHFKSTKIDILYT